ncbi:MAG TPA: thiamine-phosphate kinase [Phycisphaerae bacterium]|jgi:thiamine-monophosphate kinase
MSDGELEFVRWLQKRLPRRGTRVRVGIGDDMAVVRAGRDDVLITCDMLLDGVHFDTRAHAPEQIGRKAIACSLSDCAAMAVRPLCATVSVALPRAFSSRDARRLVQGMDSIARKFNCAIVGGDTNSWEHPLAIDIAMLATPYPGIGPVRRDGARPGDLICVSGALGGSPLGKHLTFTPRVREARRLAMALGRDLHAMMDLSDGLSLDLFRMCQASGTGAVLAETWLKAVISPAARAQAREDRQSALRHALHDGEDFELLLAVNSRVARRLQPGAGRRRARSTNLVIAGVKLWPVGRMTARGYELRAVDGTISALEPRGYEHRFGHSLGTTGKR